MMSHVFWQVLKGQAPRSLWLTLGSSAPSEHERKMLHWEEEKLETGHDVEETDQVIINQEVEEDMIKRGRLRLAKYKFVGCVSVWIGNVILWKGGAISSAACILTCVGFWCFIFGSIYRELQELTGAIY